MRDVSQCDCYDFLAARAFSTPWCDEFINIILTRHTHEGRRGVCGPLAFDHKIPEGSCQEPTFRLRNQEAQDLIDHLWSCGLRPSQARAVAGTQAAIEAPSGRHACSRFFNP